MQNHEQVYAAGTYFRWVPPWTANLNNTNIMLDHVYENIRTVKPRYFEVPRDMKKV